MWSEISPVESVVDCRPPYSFYFDLIASYWRASQDSNNLPLHRLCTLARKQGATKIVIESALARSSVREEIDWLDKACGGGGAAEAITISFFAVPGDAEFDVAGAPEGSFLGQAVVINYRGPSETTFSHSYVFEGVLHTPTIRGASDAPRPLLNNYITSESEFECVVKGRLFVVRGVYYCQQNVQTHVCAHASLRMALTSRLNQSVTATYINETLKITPPCTGLTLPQVLEVIHAQGLDANIIDCSSLQPETYASILAATVESGSKALLVFTTGDDETGPEAGKGEGAEDDGASAAGSAEEHVVLVYGHTRNSDEWHPQAIPAYAGPKSAPYYPSSNWIDHFLIHDDNFGPYYTLSSQALEFDKSVGAHWIIAVREKATRVEPHAAETSASTLLNLVLPQLAPLGKGVWFDYVTKLPWKYVLRTILISRDGYKEHLRQLKGHDGTTMDPAQIDRIDSLPERFWMVEFTLPALFTGNKAKLGEVLIASDVINPETYLDVVHAVRLPNMLLINDDGSQLKPGASGLNSHAPLYRAVSHDHEW